MMTVGEAARVVGVSSKAIRLWESKGLIPKAERTTTGYRSFTDADLSQLRFIRQAKTLGLTLGEIRSIIDMQHAGTSPCECVRQAIDGHLAAIDRKITDLVQLRDMLVIAKGAAAAVGECSGIVCPIIEQM